MESKIIHLDNVSLEDFSERFAEYQTSDAYRFLSGYKGERITDITHQKISEAVGRITCTLLDESDNTTALEITAKRFRQNKLVVRLAWHETAQSAAFNIRLWLQAFFGGPDIDTDEDQQQIEKLPGKEEQLSDIEQKRLAVCRQAIEAKNNGVTFRDFCAQRGDNPTESTLRRWIRELKSKGIEQLNWR